MKHTLGMQISLKGLYCTPSAAKVDIFFVTNKLLTKKRGWCRMLPTSREGFRKYRNQKYVRKYKAY